MQLAISQKKLLGYLNGAVVPYRRSQSMIKASFRWRLARALGALCGAGPAVHQHHPEQRIRVSGLGEGGETSWEPLIAPIGSIGARNR